MPPASHSSTHFGAILHLENYYKTSSHCVYENWTLLWRQNYQWDRLTKETKEGEFAISTYLVGFLSFPCRLKANLEKQTEKARNIRWHLRVVSMWWKNYAPKNIKYLTCSCKCTICAPTRQRKQTPKKCLHFACEVIPSRQRNGKCFIHYCHVALRHHPCPNKVNETGIEKFRDAHAQYDSRDDGKELLFFSASPSVDYVTDDEARSDHWENGADFGGNNLGEVDFFSR